jgi:hypothetical protein
MSNDNFVIKMEKFQQKSDLPDYSVSIFPNGNVSFKKKEIIIKPQKLLNSHSQIY